MTKPAQYFLTSVLFLMKCNVIPALYMESYISYSTIIQQNFSDKKTLLNGRIWRNQHSKVIGDPFFLSNTFLKGYVIFNGKKFSDLDLKYDVFSDELILSIESYPIIILNKEMVDTFSLTFGNSNYNVFNAGTGYSDVLRGYVNIIYDGPTCLYVKYTKKIQPHAVDGRYDLFYQEHSIYLNKEGEIVPLSGKKELLDLLEDKKPEIADYIRTNRLKIRQKDPNTFVPALRYYDRIKK